MKERWLAKTSHIKYEFELKCVQTHSLLCNMPQEVPTVRLQRYPNRPASLVKAFLPFHLMQLWRRFVASKGHHCFLKNTAPCIMIKFYLLRSYETLTSKLLDTQRYFLWCIGSIGEDESCVIPDIRTTTAQQNKERINIRRFHQTCNSSGCKRRRFR